ncbi:TetR/AcrR family transcriptional regulator [Corynebacterium lubricantis]|uniref:TetR/AcrR family transcriptional regulator n=1 Tax=Corynebacterium lubricantis TaxID=541095 RepID=UPI00036EBFCD|nr:TetR/AcrR family transcriptional regulator [Corynebacterium lubricantis]
MTRTIPVNPGPGRPRQEGLDERILDATLRLIDNDQQVTVNAVVSESGVSRAAVYRRWPSMTDLMAAALDKGRKPVAIDTTGDVKTALKQTIFPKDPINDSVGPNYPFRRFRKRLELMMADHDLQLSYWSNSVELRRSSPIAALRIAQERGDIQADVDLDAALDAIYGAIYYQVVVRGEDQYTPAVHKRLTGAFELVWAGMQGCGPGEPNQNKLSN